LNFRVLSFESHYAYKVKKDLSISVGAIINYAQARTDMLSSSTGQQTQGEYDWDDAWGGGLALSIFKKGELISLGASYKTRQWMSEFDKYDDVLIGPIDTPQNIQLGLAYHHNSKIDILFDYKWINWSDVKAIGTSVDKGGLGWEDQHILKCAAVYRASDKWTWRAGYSDSNSPIGSEDVFVNALTTGIIESHIGAGTSYKVDEKLTVDFAGYYGLHNSIKDDGSDFPAGANSELEGDLWLFSLGFSYKF
jgi:long-chain fatty acid transport protein